MNVLAPILAFKDRVLLQSIYYPFAMYAQRRDGTSLRPVVQGQGYESPSYGYVNYLDTSAILGESTDGRQLLHTFLVNRGLTEAAEVQIDYQSGTIQSVISAETVAGTDPNAKNTLEHPCEVTSQPFQHVHIMDGCATAKLPPLSVTAISFEVHS